MWPIPQKTADFVTFFKDIINGKLIFCAVLFNSFYVNVPVSGNCSFRIMEIIKRLGPSAQNMSHAFCADHNSGLYF